MTPLDRLLLITAATVRGQTVPVDVAAWLAFAVDRWMVSGRTLDAELDLKATAGSRRPGTRRRLACRDEAIRDIGAHLHHPSRAETARRVAYAMRRYTMSRWQTDRRHSVCPYPNYSLDAALWEAVRANEGRPLGAESVRKILGLSGGLFPTS